MVTYSIITPIYNSAGEIPAYFEKMEEVKEKLNYDFEIIFVVDASPDNSYELLKKRIQNVKYKVKIVTLSKNFGAEIAVRAGFEEASGEYCGILLIDLQDPAEVLLDFFDYLKNEPYDIIMGVRESRDDPFVSKMMSMVFWKMYRKFIMPELPNNNGGVGIFAFSRKMKESYLKLPESHSALYSQLYWLGYRRKEVLYKRKKRNTGQSTWTFRKKWNLMLNNVFSFTDLPIKFLMYMGALGVLVFTVWGGATVIAKLTGNVPVSGYTTIFLLIGFFGSLNLMGLGIVGSYAWRTYENSKSRPLSIVLKVEDFHSVKE